LGREESGWASSIDLGLLTVRKEYKSRHIFCKIQAFVRYPESKGGANQRQSVLAKKLSIDDLAFKVFEKELAKLTQTHQNLFK